MRVIGRIGNGVQVSDRTAAVRPSRSHYHWHFCREGAQAMKPSQKTCLWKYAYLVLRTIRTAAHAKRVGGSAARESKGFARAGRACQRQRRDCYQEQYVPRRCGRRGFIAVNPEARLQTDRWVNDLAMPPFEVCVGFPKQAAHPTQSLAQDMLDVDSACSVFLLRPPGSADASSRRFPLFRLREAAQSHTTDD